ncbi:hypothetical protein ABFS82_14G036000 [Erythranthe guttata]|uniref:uncharacterized protein LOC105963287 n=1 Tax=Erythranthe guttata TaxID=4155 RepID=UPI00064DB98E|nr:PREDICTED: uncharacterized protein LOC105963287 [Erythranthe guttata]|eukprot:XP_012843134.1 PREDICTED: uncharacterized protein LOC105963287 [Erythranthe guttata]
MGKEEEATPQRHVVVEISNEVEAESITTLHRRQILHRVSPQLRENKKHVYDPVVLSLGPYHHGGSQFRQTEKLKVEITNTTLDPNVRGLFRCKILDRIDEIRFFYSGLSTYEFDDEALAQMMLRDTCFVLYYIEIGTQDNDDNYNHMVHRLGLYVVGLMFRDFFVLENQIPFWIIKLLINLKINDKDEGEALLCTFLSEMNLGDNNRLTRVPWKDEEEPLHLIEAHHITLVDHEEIVATSTQRRRNLKFKWTRRKRSSPSSSFESDSNAFRSVTDLKAKGIHFRPSSNCVKDIRFNSYSFYGELYLPIRFVTNNSKVFFSNTIAFEMSPETDTNFDVASYINFMKALIENPKDVKELREKGILFSSLVNDEEVVKMFQEVDTYSHTSDYGFNLQDVTMRINEHCSSKAKTWMAELIYTYFRSPWTAIALLAATFLLCLTFLQTFYTMNPV